MFSIVLLSLIMLNPLGSTEISVGFMMLGPEIKSDSHLSQEKKTEITQAFENVKSGISSIFKDYTDKGIVIEGSLSCKIVLYKDGSKKVFISSPTLPKEFLASIKSLIVETDLCNVKNKVSISFRSSFNLKTSPKELLKMLFQEKMKD
jgi:hypothetical protein